MTVDDLREYGIVPMSDDEIQGFLSSKSVGVLGLPTEGAPALRPMSFGYDGERTLYFVYLLGSESRKQTLSDRADAARFLVYSAETSFNWRSVLLTGALTAVPETDHETARSTLETAWRPDVLERASETAETALYELRIDEQVGYKHLGLPPAFESESG